MVSEEIRFSAYVICTSPRSGSTLLCRLLAATGKTGDPDSHFHSPSVSDWMGYYAIPCDQYAKEQERLAAIFKAAHNRGLGNTGIFGLRLQHQSFEYFMRKLRVLSTGSSADSDIDHIENYFGKTLFIHLTRKNKLEQAISLLKANQTGLWHKAPDGTAIEKLPAEKTLRYDHSAIARNLVELTDMEDSWVSWFADQGIKPLRISYDDLSADPEQILGQILVQLGVDIKHSLDIEVPVAKLADSTNKLWAIRYCTEQ